MAENKIRVIVAEDEKLIAKNIAKNIERENSHFQVDGIFANGEDAFRAVQELLPDVVFTDISMPVMTGLELAKMIHESFGHVKCVILTGYADFEYAKAALRYGVEDYLLKPLNTEELGKVLKNIEISLSTTLGVGRLSASEHTFTPEEIVATVKEYMQKNYAKEIDLNSIADNLGFSSSYLTKVFNKVEGTAPLKYIRNYRMEIAKKMLAEKDVTVAEVGEAVGYRDPFHFSKSFKQTFGVSPTEYKTKGIE